MTIKKFAEDRGISYDRACRACKAVILDAGKTMRAGRVPTELDADDVARADDWLSKVGTKAPRVGHLVNPQRQFEAAKLEWTNKWEEAAYRVEAESVDLSNPLFAVLGLMSSAASPGFFEREWGTGRMGDAVLKVAMKAGVDLDPTGGDVPWTGFTRWLIDQGYSHAR